MYSDVLSFWFDEINPSQWWQQNSGLDRIIKFRFGETHAQAIRCELFDWRKTAEGRLAEIIVIDQFSRNIFRGSPLSFAYDPLALALAQEAVSTNEDKALPESKRCFFYMPFMHSESLEIHSVAMDLYQRNGIKSNLDAEIQHKRIIQRFGRYPHRNDILGRASTEEEIRFLQQPGVSF